MKSLLLAAVVLLSSCATMEEKIESVETKPDIPNDLIIGCVDGMYGAYSARAKQLVTTNYPCDRRLPNLRFQRESGNPT